MVISVITSGLGNQLFQYAAGRALAARLKTSLKLDTSFFRNNAQTKRTFELGRFSMALPEATPMEKWALSRLARPRVAGLTAGFQKLGLPLKSAVLYDRQQGFEEQVMSVTGHAYLNGMWQSERYFSASADLIRQEFSFRSEPDAANRAAMDTIQSTEAIALHVRRGDYITRPEFGACGLDYYHRAIDNMAGRVSNPHFFIFSDDPDWTKENIKLQFPATYITHNTGIQDGEDLRLMSHCRHFIIANSTFSWWGAWLSKNPAKYIIAPRRWFAGASLAAIAPVPDEWVQL